MAERAELYVLGDSISMHYGLYLKRFLEPAVGYSRKGEGLAAGDLNLVSDANGGDSRSCLEFLETNLPLLAERFDWLLWNCGLHDIKTTAAGRQVSPECYAANLERGVELVRKSGLQLLWCRTTGVCDELHNLRCRDFSRFRADVELYNRLADRVMEEHRIPVCDLSGSPGNSVTRRLPITFTTWNGCGNFRGRFWPAGFFRNSETPPRTAEIPVSPPVSRRRFAISGKPFIVRNNRSHDFPGTAAAQRKTGEADCQWKILGSILSTSRRGMTVFSARPSRC